MIRLADIDLLNRFDVIYTCHCITNLPGPERPDLNNGGSIILPPSALDRLTRLDMNLMLFKLSNPSIERSTHCGVLEFIAEEGQCFLPSWMMHNLVINDGSHIRVQSAILPVATFTIFEPQSIDFLDITDPKSVLERTLRHFFCLTTGDVVGIHYNDTWYELRVVETRPGPAVNILSCDMEVEFAPPIGYVEPENPRKRKQEDIVEEVDYDTPDFIPFIGTGNRLDGKKIAVDAQETQSASLIPHRRGVPDFNYQLGTLQFFHNAKFRVKSTTSGTSKIFHPFEGTGKSLRSKVSIKPSGNE